MYKALLIIILSVSFTPDTYSPLLWKNTKKGSWLTIDTLDRSGRTGIEERDGEIIEKV